MRVIIVSAGIGGSALALSLAKLGFDYVLLEQARAFTEVGAGIQLSPNGVRVLETLGLGDALAAFCTEPDFHKYSVWDTGETLLRTPLRPQVRPAYGYAYYHAYRADLIAALTGGLDPSRLRLQSRVVAVGQDTARSYSSGSTRGLPASRVVAVGQDTARAWADCESGERITGDLLVGADGIHSLVREQAFSPDEPRASGYVTWRGVVDRRRIADLGIPVSAHVDMGPRLSFVYYWVSGGTRLNWLALAQADGHKRES